MRRVAAVAALVLLLAGCSSTHAATPAHNSGDIHDDAGGNFLPAYLRVLQGDEPYPTEEPPCEAHTVEQLMLGCDRP